MSRDSMPDHVQLFADGTLPAGRVSGPSRRSLLRACLAGAGGLFLPRTLSLAAPSPTDTAGTAKAVIQIWLWGGSCHIDTFDPKPEAGPDYCGQLAKPIKTNVDGIMIGELLPELAKQADKYALIRSMTHGVNAHETASYMVQTGRMPGDRIVYPCAGAVVAYFKGGEDSLQAMVPPYIVLTQLQGRFSEAGFLGSRYKPFATGGDPGKAKFVVEGIVADGITDEHQQKRRELLGNLGTFKNALAGDETLAAYDQAGQQAYDMILGEGAKVFDLSTEEQALRDRYGKTTFGQSCLMARRLVERGVKYITINYKGWDTHKQHFQIMRRLLPELDKGLSSLLQDLSDHKLLDSTVVWCCGEFGRTPRVQMEAPWNGGRGHYGNVFSALVAGGGFKGGRVVGSSDAKGENVKDRPVYPCDLIGSMYQLLGIDPSATLPHPQGMQVRLTPSPEDGVQSGGLLKEIM